MKNQNTSIPEDLERCTLKNQVEAILSNQFLRGRLLINSIYSQKNFNLPSELYLQIKILPQNISYSNCSIEFVHLKITLPAGFPYQEPSFILWNSYSSTYREKELEINRCWDPSWKIAVIIEDIVRSIDQKIIDIGFMDLSRSKVNLVSQLYEQNQGLNISRNSCFKYSSRTRPGPEVGKQSVSQQVESKIEGDLANLKGSQKKRSNQPMKKNANLPKFLIRIFIKYVEKFRKLYPKKEFDRLNNQCKKMKEWKRSESKQQALGLKHLKMLFQEYKDGFPDPRVNRQIASSGINLSKFTNSPNTQIGLFSSLSCLCLEMQKCYFSWSNTIEMIRSITKYIYIKEIFQQ